jgi:hypothetical protein
VYNTWSRGDGCIPRLLSFFSVSRPGFDRSDTPRALLYQFQLPNGYTGRTCGRRSIILGCASDSVHGLSMMFLDMLPCHRHVLAFDLSRLRMLEVIGNHTHCNSKARLLLPPKPEIWYALSRPR